MKLRHTLTRALAFHATHRYHVAAWDEEANQRVFGWTTTPPGHGHLYRIEVTVTGSLRPVTGMIMDLVELDAILAEEIVAPLAGQHLNAVLPEVVDGTTQPTCEVIARWCFQRVAARLPSDVTLAGVRVAEDPTLWAECLGPT